MNGKVMRLKLMAVTLGALVLMFGAPLSVTPQSAAGGAPPQKLEEVAYTCPMHPEVRSKTAGSCPKCGMFLKQESHAPEARATTTATTRYGADYFPNIELTTQDGKKVKFYDDLLKGKIVAITLIYTHCLDNCPLETARMAQVQRLLGDRVGKDIFFYSISIDPKRDTPEVLKDYAEKFHAGPGWLFLTGKESDIELLSRKLGLYSAPDPANRDGHTPTLLVGDVASAQWRKYSALDNPSFITLKMGELMDGYNRKLEVTKQNYANAPTLNFTNGQYLYSTRCAACHTIGKGDAIGPDLLGVTGARDRTWLKRFIAVPDQVLAEKDPLATALFEKYKKVQMPNLRLNEEDVNSLVLYLEQQTAAKSKQPAPEVQK
ncbi:MAG TPA: SCO family protein [Pyrinomonadaceae bacterium]